MKERKTHPSERGRVVHMVKHENLIMNNFHLESVLNRILIQGMKYNRDGSQHSFFKKNENDYTSPRYKITVDSCSVKFHDNLLKRKSVVDLTADGGMDEIESRCKQIANNYKLVTGLYFVELVRERESSSIDELIDVKRRLWEKKYSEIGKRITTESDSNLNYIAHAYKNPAFSKIRGVVIGVIDKAQFKLHIEYIDMSNEIDTLRYIASQIDATIQIGYRLAGLHIYQQMQYLAQRMAMCDVVIPSALINWDKNVWDMNYIELSDLYGLKKNSYYELEEMLIGLGMNLPRKHMLDCGLNESETGLDRYDTLGMENSSVEKLYKIKMKYIMAIFSKTFYANNT